MSKHRILILSGLLLICVFTCSAQWNRYISTERPVVNYNPKYVLYANVSTQRYGRHDLVYYTNMYYHNLVYVDNNVTLNMYFCELTSLTQTRAFLDLHFKFCDLVHKNKILGPILKRGDLDRPCPYPPGEYHLTNMTIPAEVIPSVFPLTKGRLFMNTTITGTQEYLLNGYIDIEVKTYRRRKPKK